MQYVISRDGTVFVASDCFIMELDDDLAGRLLSDASDSEIGEYARQHGRPVA